MTTRSVSSGPPITALAIILQCPCSQVIMTRTILHVNQLGLEILLRRLPLVLVPRLTLLIILFYFIFYERPANSFFLYSAEVVGEIGEALERQRVGLKMLGHQFGQISREKIPKVAGSLPLGDRWKGGTRISTGLAGGVIHGVIEIWNRVKSSSGLVIVIGTS